VVGVICDTSVAVTWFHAAGEQEVDEARAIASAIGDRVAVRVPDLIYLELGNVLLLKKRTAPGRVARVLGQLRVLTGVPLRIGPPELVDTLDLAARHRLTVYDASYWALARSTEFSLLTTDRELLAAGAGETPAQLCERLGLS
jgi:predicted nucleic acid-binding protein